MALNEDALEKLRNREWLERTTAEDWVQVLIGCLRAGDIHGVEAALRVLAVKDPHRAQEVIDTLKLGIWLRERQETPPS